MNLHSPSKSKTNSRPYINSLLYFDMFVFYDWLFPQYFAKNVANVISVLILGSVFSDCVVFSGHVYGDTIFSFSVYFVHRAGAN